VRGTEVQAAGDLAGDALGGIGSLIHDVHASVARRAFAGPGAPIKPIHDAISRAIYSGVGGGLKLAGRAAGTVLPDPSPLILGALNGAVGDVLKDRYRPLALEMTAHADAARGATPKVVVFVHGLGETGDSWKLGGRPTYGARLAADHGYTPVYVTYNSGLHISDNGQTLAERIDEVVAGWPVAVDDLVLVGHSMGGLVVRSACHYAGRDDRPWTKHLSNVFCLGTPHLGAPLEQAANVAGWALGRLPETKPFAKVVNGRSVGIKDLRYGACVEDDWSGCDPDEFLRDRCTEVPFTPTADYYFIGASLGRREGDVVDRLVGDLLVLYTSASGVGKKRRIGFEVDRGKRFDGVNHFQLLNHPKVYEQLEEWLRADGETADEPLQLLGGGGELLG
jgi:pimeloyl-ACP methyl ester carboxylesterase